MTLIQIFGIIVIANSIFVPLLLAASGRSHGAVLWGISLLGVFGGAFLMLQDRTTELTIKNVGTIKAAAQQSTLDAKQINDIKTRVEAQGATVDLVAREAAEAKKLTEQLKEKNQSAETKLRAIDSTLKKATASLVELQSTQQASRDYADVVQLNMIGKPNMDGDLVYTTPISTALEGTYEIKGHNVTFRSDLASEAKFRDAIARFPKFPFAYICLAVALRNRGDPSWLDFAKQGEAILEKTTLVPGHHPNHDYFLTQVREMMAIKQ
jgi:hypothetical protein